MPNQGIVTFPGNFLWGAATSSYQVEGDNFNSDWWEWEYRIGLREKCGHACRHYALYKEDFDLARSLNHNAHRLSIEWSRVQPEPDTFSDSQIEHYLEVVEYLKASYLEPIITLHHFTNPLWLAKLGGWENRKSVDYFLDYVSKIVQLLSNKVKYWVTINEPNVYIHHSYILGQWPPQEKSLHKARRVLSNLILAHTRAYQLIHDIYRTARLKAPYVTIAQNMQAFVPCIPTFRNRLAVCLRNNLYNFGIIDRLTRGRSLDIIGINYYSRTLVEVQKWRLKNMLLDDCRMHHSKARKNSLGWDIYPEGLYSILLRLKRYKLPIVILENGICTQDDILRWDFIREHLYKVNQAMQKGCNILGYFYWSLMDNYEWDQGFRPRFGLIEVDYRTYKRTVRESAKHFASVCKSFGLG